MESLEDLSAIIPFKEYPYMLPSQRLFLYYCRGNDVTKLRKMYYSVFHHEITSYPFDDYLINGYKYGSIDVINQIKNWFPTIVIDHEPYIPFNPNPDIYSRCNRYKLLKHILVYGELNKLSVFTDDELYKSILQLDINITNVCLTIIDRIKTDVNTIIRLYNIISRIDNGYKKLCLLRYLVNISLSSGFIGLAKSICKEYDIQPNGYMYLSHISMYELANNYTKYRIWILTPNEAKYHHLTTALGIYNKEDIAEIIKQANIKPFNVPLDCAGFIYDTLRLYPYEYPIAALSTDYTDDFINVVECMDYVINGVNPDLFCNVWDITSSINKARRNLGIYLTNNRWKSALLKWLEDNNEINIISLIALLYELGDKILFKFINIHNIQKIITLIDKSISLFDRIVDLLISYYGYRILKYYPNLISDKIVAKLSADTINEIILYTYPMIPAVLVKYVDIEYINNNIKDVSIYNEFTLYNILRRHDKN